MNFRQEFEPVEREQVLVCGPGVTAPQFEPGDFLLTHGRAWTSRIIRFGQALRFRGEDAKYARWNHAAIVVDEQGDLVEALGAGVQKRHISVYDGTEYRLVRISASAADRRQAAAFALWCLDQPYAFVTIGSIALSLLTGAKFTFAFDGQQICSGLVARALERTDAIFNRTPSHIMPADLAKYFGVEPPPKGTPKGAVPPP
ncbi:MAG: hypothetical protein WD981_05510 [Gaiellaceae bacterium]